MDSVAKVTFSGSKTVSEKILPEIHLLPCKINYTGPAKVKAYFQRESVGENGEEQSTFRGRYLNGSMMHLPDGYKMFVTKQRTTNGIAFGCFIQLLSVSSIKL
uniref:ZP domain-containing protein n=1 Tax=Ascaris lumbricoides TaxID=6252 RepID=A0A0M3HGJ1_ASCLU